MICDGLFTGVRSFDDRNWGFHKWSLVRVRRKYLLPGHGVHEAGWEVVIGKLKRRSTDAPLEGVEYCPVSIYGRNGYSQSTISFNIC